jgi:hypothetical protein
MNRRRNLIDFNKDKRYNRVMADEHVEIQNFNTLKNNSFKTERDLLDYITENMSKFVEDVFNDVLVSFEREKVCHKQPNKFGPMTRRVDLYVVCEENIYIIELKNPKYLSENRKAIGQLLDYGRDFSDPRKKMVLITALFDIDTAKTIEYYNLPISYIYFDKDKSLEYVRLKDG